MLDMKLDKDQKQALKNSIEIFEQIEEVTFHDTFIRKVTRIVKIKRY